MYLLIMYVMSGTNSAPCCCRTWHAPRRPWAGSTVGADPPETCYWKPATRTASPTPSRCCWANFVGSWSETARDRGGAFRHSWILYLCPIVSRDSWCSRMNANGFVPSSHKMATVTGETTTVTVLVVLFCRLRRTL